MLAENDFVNHSLNQIFRWIFAGAKVENRILIPKFIFKRVMDQTVLLYLLNAATTVVDILNMEEGINMADYACYQEGFWVRHSRFGAGVILEREESCVSVQFESGIKRILLHSNKLIPLDINEAFNYGGLEFLKITGKDELEVVGAINPNVDKVVIPSHILINGQDFPVTVIRKLAFANMKRLTDVTIPVSVVTIDSLAFVGSDKIKQIRNESCGRYDASFVMNERARWGILPNPERKVPFIPCQFEDIHFYACFMDERQKNPTFYFLVRENDLWGIINKTGHQLVPCIYDALFPKEEGHLCIGFEYRQGNRCGLIDARGNEV